MTFTELPDELKADIVGPVITITINRPQKLNTLTPAMGRALKQLVLEINENEQVRVVILKGEGERAFSAGSDVSVLDEYGTNWQLRNRTDYAREIWAIRKPVIAQIRGHCVGGGLELALLSDIRVADHTASFASGEIKLGWHGGAGNTQLLPRTIPLGGAALMLFTGDPVSAAEALRLGLVDVLVEPDQLDHTVADIAERIARNSPIAVQLTKHLIRTSQSTSLEVGLAHENDLFAYCFTTNDSQEGRAAFAERRPPNFAGN
ncbi:enoyl-CoA hydratase/isomerase family protein [Nakamurella antarctica]|uniref:Enoyl-CoA hydratase/isomerase family protein n=1 Tax=Nakamurella antarctica TaxID=1902245 RepID=A0A3G8ZM62_9ACTN|nr:enoyl-CoA hydratase/isomerase family protein [Nakamurella antarctica]AZI58442.1 enoyl-CoA hydratase/isomerase family protein [Nakamurella antarctica]